MVVVTEEGTPVVAGVGTGANRGGTTAVGEVVVADVALGAGTEVVELVVVVGATVVGVVVEVGATVVVTFPRFVAPTWNDPASQGPGAVRNPRWSVEGHSPELTATRS